ncbi:MAG: hypothetical protein ACLFUB_17080 [Cyclobacteriaceae bacterium]
MYHTSQLVLEVDSSVQKALLKEEDDHPDIRAIQDVLTKNRQESNVRNWQVQPIASSAFLYLPVRDTSDTQQLIDDLQKVSCVKSAYLSPMGEPPVA